LGDDIVCESCLLEDPAGSIDAGDYINNADKAITWAEGPTLAAMGWTQWAPGDPKRYESGWHPGQDDDPRKVLDGYRNLEKLLGADKANNAVIIPKADADAKEWAAVYDRLGRPSSPDGYGLKFPEGGNKEAQQAFLSKMHELGITKSQAEGLFNDINSRALNDVNARKAEAQARFQQEDQAVRAEWGQAYQKHLAQAQAAAKGLGLDAPTIDKLSSALGHKNTLTLLQKIGATMGEDSFVSPGSNTGFSNALTPGQAKAQIQSLMSDRDFTRQYMNGNSDARAKMEALHRYAYPEG
jgi:hypothetical protein